MTLKIICVAYERPIAMRGLIDCFLLQTSPNWELRIIHDGCASQCVRDVIALYNDPRIIFIETEERTQTYGHLNRRRFLNEQQGDVGDFVLMTNDDNYYVPIFVDYMLGRIGANIGMVYCDSVHSHFQYIHHTTQVKLNHIDIGSFIVRLDIAKSVGFTGTAFNADGIYAIKCYDLCRRSGLCAVYVPKPLFIHN